MWGERRLSVVSHADRVGRITSRRWISFCNYYPPNNDIKLIKYVFNLCRRTHRCLPSQLGFTETEFPEGDPTIADVKQYYSIGENLEANCTSNSSIPPARLEWWINDLPVYNAEYTIKYKPIADHSTNRETSILGLRLPLTNEHFYRARVKVSSRTYFFARHRWRLSFLVAQCFMQNRKRWRGLMPE